MALENKGRKRKVLVVDSSSSVRTSLWMILKDEYVVLTVSDLPEALEVVGREEVEIVLVGVDLPLFFYESFFRALRQVQPRLPLLLLMGEGAVWEKRFGLPLSDGLSKPFAVESLREKVEALLLQRDWVEQRGGERRILSVEERIKSWLYSSRVAVGVRERVLKVAGCSLPVFIQGEEGTGRSGVARAVHLLGSWRGRPFLRFFCRGNSRIAFRRIRQRCLYDGEGEAMKDSLNRDNFFSRFFRRHNSRNAFRNTRQYVHVHGVSTSHDYAHFEVCVQVLSLMSLEFRIQKQEWL